MKVKWSWGSRPWHLVETSTNTLADVMGPLVSHLHLVKNCLRWQSSCKEPPEPSFREPSTFSESPPSSGRQAALLSCEAAAAADPWSPCPVQQPLLLLSTWALCSLCCHLALAPTNHFCPQFSSAAGQWPCWAPRSNRCPSESSLPVPVPLSLISVIHNQLLASLIYLHLSLPVYTYHHKPTSHPASRLESG